MPMKLPVKNAIPLFLFCFLFSFCGCKNVGVSFRGNNKEPVILVYLVDVSGIPISDRIKLHKNFKKCLERVLNSSAVKSDGLIVVGAVMTKNFAVSGEFFEPVFFETPSILGKTTHKIKKEQKEKLELIYAQSKNAFYKAPQQGIDLMGSFKKTGDSVFHNNQFEKSPKKIMVIFSDMYEQNGKYNLLDSNLNQENLSEILAHEKKNGLIPDLSGVDVWIAGAFRNVEPVEARLVNDLQYFWLSYFRNSGATIDNSRISSAILNIDIDSKSDNKGKFIRKKNSSFQKKTHYFNRRTNPENRTHLPKENRNYSSPKNIIGSHASQSVIKGKVNYLTGSIVIKERNNDKSGVAPTNDRNSTTIPLDSNHKPVVDQASNNNQPDINVSFGERGGGVIIPKSRHQTMGNYNGMVSEYGHEKIFKMKNKIFYPNGVDYFYETGFSPLHYAVWNGETNKLRSLIKNVKDIESKSETGFTLIHLIVIKNRTDYLDEIVSRGANINARDRFFRTPLYLAIVYGREYMVKRLLDFNADPNLKADYGKSPIHLAVEQNNTGVVEQLVQFGVNVNSLDDIGNSPIHYSAKHGDYYMAMLLINGGANINLPDSYGRTPLHISALYNRIGTAKLFISNRADISLKDSAGLTPFDIAVRNGHKEMAELLRQK